MKEHLNFETLIVVQTIWRFWNELNGILKWEWVFWVELLVSYIIKQICAKND